MEEPTSDRLLQLMQFLEKTPGEAFLLFAIAKEYEGLGLPDKALQQYLKLQDQHPEYVGLYYHLGKLYEKMRNPELALEAYDQGIVVAKAKDDRHAWSELAEARLGLVED